MTIIEHATESSIIFDEKNIYAVAVRGGMGDSCIYKLVRTDDKGGPSSHRYVFQSEADTKFHLGDECHKDDLPLIFKRVIEGTQCCVKGSPIYEFDDYIEFLQWCINKEVAHRGRQD